MDETEILEGRPRNERGSPAARRQRRRGELPGVVYGHKEETITLTLPTEQVQRAVRHGARVVELKLGDKQEKVFIKELQWDHLGKELLHVDLARVSEHDRIVVHVPLELRGTAAGVSAGGVMDQPIHSLLVECQAINIPKSIRVNIGDLQVGSAIHVREVVLPEGVVAKSDPDAIVVHVKLPVLEVEAPVAAEAAEKAEPEVITQKKVEEEGEGE